MRFVEMCEESELSELSPGPHSCCRVVVSSNFVKFDKFDRLGPFGGIRGVTVSFRTSARFGSVVEMCGLS